MLQPPGSSSTRRAAPSSRRKTQETPDDVIRKLQRLAPNKHCADCGSKLPSCVNLSVGTFVCMTCAGIHRSMSQKIKGVGHSSFTQEEAEAMKQTDNDQVNAVYLARYDQQRERMRQPQGNTDPTHLKAWIHRKYVDKSWYGVPQSYMEQHRAPPQQRQPQRQSDVQQQPTMVQMPPKEQAAPQQPVDLFGGFDAPWAPAPAPAPVGNWDTFGNQRQSAPASAPDNGFPADFGSTATRNQQKATFQADFSQANAPTQLQQPAFQADFTSQQPPQQQATFQADFGSKQPQPSSHDQQASFQENFGGPPQQQPSFQANFSGLPEQQQNARFQTSFESAPQQNQAYPTNFGAQAQQPPFQANFGNQQAPIQPNQPPQPSFQANFGPSPLKNVQNQSNSSMQVAAPIQGGMQQQQNRFQQQQTGLSPAQSFQQPTLSPRQPAQHMQPPKTPTQQTNTFQPSFGQLSSPTVPSLQSKAQGLPSPSAVQQNQAPDLNLPSSADNVSKPKLSTIGSSEQAPPEVDIATAKASSARPAQMFRYTAGQKVFYKSTSYVGEAEIVKVHHDDDLEPFYTIKVDGREKQTDDAHLSGKHPIAEEIEKMLVTLDELKLKQVKEFVEKIGGGTLVAPTDASSVVSGNASVGNTSAQMNASSSIGVAQPRIILQPSQSSGFSQLVQSQGASQSSQAGNMMMLSSVTPQMSGGFGGIPSPEAAPAPKLEEMQRQVPAPPLAGGQMMSQASTPQTARRMAASQQAQMPALTQDKGPSMMMQNQAPAQQFQQPQIAMPGPQGDSLPGTMASITASQMPQAGAQNSAPPSSSMSMGPQILQPQQPTMSVTPQMQMQQPQSQMQQPPQMNAMALQQQAQIQVQEQLGTMQINAPNAQPGIPQAGQQPGQPPASPQGNPFDIY